MNHSVLKFLFSLVLIGVLATAFFGFSVMINSSGKMMAGCFGFAPATNCSVVSSIEHFEAHFGAFQQISTAVTQASSLLSALFLLLLAAIILSFGEDDLLQRLSIAVRRDDGASPQRIQLTHWLALREKRDPSSIYAMN